MKKFLLVIPVLLFFFGCKIDDGKEDLKQALREFEPTTQIFEINKDSLVEIRGAKGTILKIDPSVLQHLDGSMVASEIEVHLMELTTTEDLLRANAQTVSNGKWLMSGGAYKIQIYADNKELKIADGKSIEVNFPKIASEEMQLFDGNRNVEGNLNSELSNQVLNEKKYPVLIQKDSMFVRINRAFNIIMSVDTMIYKVLDKKLTLKNFINKYTQVDSIFIKSDTINARIFNKLSRRDSIYISNESKYNMLRSRFNSMLDEVYGSISVSRLGWFNIERPYSEIKDEVEFKLITDHEMDGEEFFVIDTEKNTVVNLFGYKTIIFNAPLNKQFHIVAFATRDQDIYAFKKQIVIEKNGKLEVKFKKIINKDEISSYFKLD